MKKYLLLILMGTTLLSGCAGLVKGLFGIEELKPFNAKTYTGYVEKRSDEKFKADALKDIRDSAFDPDSVKFKNLSLVTKFKRKFLCGEWNAKNRLGGYVGFNAFIYYINVYGEMNFIEDEETEIIKVIENSKVESISSRCQRILISNLVDANGEIATRLVNSKGEVIKQ